MALPAIIFSGFHSSDMDIAQILNTYYDVVNQVDVLCVLVLPDTFESVDLLEGGIGDGKLMLLT